MSAIKEDVIEENVKDLIELLTKDKLETLGVIPWASPVPCFGRLATAQIATLGLNPSNLEFVDSNGSELIEVNRRLHTLKSLELSSWEHANFKSAKLIAESCKNYFEKNPYRRWFNQLDFLFSLTGCSYFSPSNGACHLDLVPFATSEKWSEIEPHKLDKLKSIGASTLTSLLGESSIRLLILNGALVVAQFQSLFGYMLNKFDAPRWSLPRKNGKHIQGVAYDGRNTITLTDGSNRDIRVIGFNHNIQSSYGISNGVRTCIREWVGEIWDEVTG